MFAVQPLRAQIHKHQMVVGAAADQPVAGGGSGVRQGFRIAHVCAENRENPLQRFRTKCFRGDDMFEWTPLDSGKNLRVDRFAWVILQMMIPPRGPRRLFVGGTRR